MSQILDQSMDLNGVEFHRICALYGDGAVNGQPMTKYAANSKTHGSEDLDSGLYADSLRRLYPIHTPAATWTSAAFFYEKQAALPPQRASIIEKRIKEAAAIHQISDDIEKLEKKVAQSLVNDMALLPDEVFGYVSKMAGKEAVRRYPMRNTAEVKIAASYLHEFRDKFNWEARHKFAQRILHRAELLGADIGDKRTHIEKTAGHGIGSVEDIASEIRKRIRTAKLAKDGAALVPELEKLATSIEATTFDRVPAHDLVQLLDDVDVKIGAMSRRGADWEYPEDVIYGITPEEYQTKIAELIGNTQTGTFYKQEELAGLPLSKLADTLGEDVMDAVTTNGVIDLQKMAEILPTLPLGDAKLFDQLAAAAGVRPFAQKESSIRQGLTRANRKAIAAKHPKGNTGGLWGRLRN